jgi:hypothetical protein
MLECEESARSETKVSQVIERRPKVGVATAKDIVRGQNQGFGTTESRHYVIGIDLKRQKFSLGNGLVDPTVEFTKGGLCRHTHPHNKVLIRDALKRTDNVGIGLVKIPRLVSQRVKVSVALVRRRIVVGCVTGRIGSVATTCVTLTRWTFGKVETIRLLVHIFNVTGPCDSLFYHFQFSASAITTIGQREIVVEECIRNQPARIQSHVSHLVERIAQFFLDGGLIAHFAQQLKVIAALKVITVVLVKVGEFVIDKNRWSHIFRGREYQFAATIGVVRCANTADRRIILVVIVRHFHLYDILFQRVDLIT